MSSPKPREISHKGRYKAIYFNEPSNDVALKLDRVSKRYRIYKNSKDAILALVSQRYRRSLDVVDALKKISITVRQGECVSVFGEAHSGKSTLIKLISGLILPSTGNLETHGRILVAAASGSDFDMRQNTQKNLINRAKLAGLNNAEALEATKRAIELAQVEDYRDTPHMYLPMMLRKRLGFALSVNLPCNTLLLEYIPQSSDTEFRERFYEHLDAMVNEEQTTVMFVTNEPIVFGSNMRFVHLADGEIVFDGGINELDLESIKLKPRILR